MFYSVNRIIQVITVFLFFAHKTHKLPIPIPIVCVKIAPIKILNNIQTRCFMFSNNSVQSAALGADCQTIINALRSNDFELAFTTFLSEDTRFSHADMTAISTDIEAALDADPENDLLISFQACFNKNIRESEPTPLPLVRPMGGEPIVSNSADEKSSVNKKPKPVTDEKPLQAGDALDQQLETIWKAMDNQDYQKALTFLVKVNISRKKNQQEFTFVEKQTFASKFETGFAVATSEDVFGQISLLLSAFNDQWTEIPASGHPVEQPDSAGNKIKDLQGKSSKEKSPVSERSPGSHSTSRAGQELLHHIGDNKFELAARILENNVGKLFFTEHEKLSINRMIDSINIPSHVTRLKILFRAAMPASAVEPTKQIVHQEQKSVPASDSADEKASFRSQTSAPAKITPVQSELEKLVAELLELKKEENHAIYFDKVLGLLTHAQKACEFADLITSKTNTTLLKDQVQQIQAEVSRRLSPPPLFVSQDTIKKVGTALTRLFETLQAGVEPYRFEMILEQMGRQNYKISLILLLKANSEMQQQGISFTPVQKQTLEDAILSGIATRLGDSKEDSIFTSLLSALTNNLTQLPEENTYGKQAGSAVSERKNDRQGPAEDKTKDSPNKSVLNTLLADLQASLNDESSDFRSLDLALKSSAVLDSLAVDEDDYLDELQILYRVERAVAAKKMNPDFVKTDLSESVEKRLNHLIRSLNLKMQMPFYDEKMIECIESSKPLKNRCDQLVEHVDGLDDLDSSIKGVWFAINVISGAAVNPRALADTCRQIYTHLWTDIFNMLSELEALKVEFSPYELLRATALVMINEVLKVPAEIYVKSIEILYKRNYVDLANKLYMKVINLPSFASALTKEQSWRLAQMFMMGLQKQSANAAAAAAVVQQQPQLQLQTNTAAAPTVPVGTQVVNAGVVEEVSRGASVLMGGKK